MRQVEVHDNWAGSPGATVVAAGESKTREGRLIDWADDVDKIFVAQVAALGVVVRSAITF